MYKKIQPLLENLHRNFMETRNTIGEQSREGRAGQWGVPGPCLPAPQSYPGQMVPWFLGAALNSGILQPNPGESCTISPRDSSMPSGTSPRVHAVPAALSSSLPSGLELGWISVGRDRWSGVGDGGHSWRRVRPSPRLGGRDKARQLRVWCWAEPPGPMLFLQSTSQGALGPALPGKKLIHGPSAGGDLVPPTCLLSPT